MRRIIVFAYGVIAYAVFFGTFVYAAGFVGDILVPKSIDSIPQVPFGEALLTNIVLLGIFAVQHTVMARPEFKRWLTRFVPKPAERSTYVLLASLALIALFAFWQPMGGVIWDVENPTARAALYGLFACGWGTVLVTTWLINHFDLFGLRQVWLYLRRKEYTPLRFVTPGPYKLVRHPMYIGWFLAFWATPTMTAAHLVFAIATTVYILIAIWFEERDLVKEHGRNYVDYRRRVPMLIPRLSKRRTVVEPQSNAA